MYLIIYIIILIFILQLNVSKETFENSKNTSIISRFMNISPNSMIEGMYNTIHPYIPFKNKYYKLRRHLRSK
jgi:hypothetical protein